MSLESIRLQLQELASEVFGRPVMQVPPEWQDWAKDLRRGRMWIGGGTLRFMELLAGQNIGRQLARSYAERALNLELQAMELLLPVSPDPKPGHTVQPFRSATNRDERAHRGVGGDSIVGSDEVSGEWNGGRAA